MPATTVQSLKRGRTCAGTSVAVIAVAALTGAAAVTAAQTINIGGLTQPTSFAWDEAGRVYIAEKEGRIKIAPSFAATSALPLIDLRSRVTSYGDHGVTSLDYRDGYLYATYSALNPTFGNVCADRGQPDNRPPSAIQGCTVYGRLSRWPVSNGTVAGPEQVLVGENSTLRVCAQFATGPIDYALVSSDGRRVLFSAGSGANTFTVDSGNMGTNPCGTGAAWGGAFRALDNRTLDGKLASYDLATGAITIIARGFNNPWRFALQGNETAFVGDTGISAYEEISAVNLTRAGEVVWNSGFPCYEGPFPLRDYQALNSSWCRETAVDPFMVAPIYSYTAPTNTSRVSISAVSTTSSGRVFFGDYSQSTISSMMGDGRQVRVEMSPAWPVDMAEVPGWGLAYVDIVRGAVRSVVASGGPTSGVAGVHVATQTWAASTLAALCAVVMVMARRQVEE